MDCEEMLPLWKLYMFEDIGSSVALRDYNCLSFEDILLLYISVGDYLHLVF